MKNNTTTFDESKDKHFGKHGTVEREEFEAGYENFKTGVLQEAEFTKEVLGKITKEQVLKFVSENHIELNSTHQKLCIPIINRIYRKMLVGIKFAEIKVGNGCICDGHHRYLASLLAKYFIETVPYTNTSATVIIDWKSVVFEEDDWDTPTKIKMLNEIDADYSNIPIEELTELLK